MAEPSDFFRAIRTGRREAVRAALDRDPRLLAVRDASGLSPLLVALYHDQPEIAGDLLARGPVLDLFEAAAAGDVARVRALVATGADADAYAGDGFTALGLAAFFKRRDVVRELLRAGADARLASLGPRFTPLHSAVATDAGPLDRDIVRMLVDAGADPNARSASGGTPLHTAAFIGDADLVRYLLARGADPSVRTNDGKTPADTARERGHEALAPLLTS